jgi:hypothetical protein
MKSGNQLVTANFFWHGAKLRLYERACLTSFINAGLSVHIYTFNDALEVPPGAKRLDAKTFGRQDEVSAFTQGGKSSSIAAFTDLFRYRLLKSETGWWFDTDVFCLASAEAFRAVETRSRGLLVGEESPGKFNGAVLYVSDSSIAGELEQRAAKKGNVFRWGAIGPRLITEFVREHPARSTILPSEVFYPLHYGEIDLAFRPERTTECFERTKQSLSLHLWNEILRMWSIPTEIMPCRDSFLYQLFQRTAVEVEPMAALPEETMQELQYFGRIGSKDRCYIRTMLSLRRTQKRLSRALRLKDISFWK